MRPWKNSAVILMFVALCALALAACGSKQQSASQEAAQAQQSQAQQPQAGQSGPASQANQPMRAAEGSSRASEQRPVAPREEAPKLVTYTVPAGTPVHIRLDQALSSGTATSGTPFSGTLSSPLVAGGVVVVPAGSAVSGEVVAAKKGGRIHSPALLSLQLTSLRPTGGQNIAIATNSWTVQGKSQKKRDAELIGGGGGVGALIGALAGHGKGAAIGAAVGAAGGTAGAAFTGQKQVVLGAEHAIRFVLAQPITITRRATGGSQ